MFVVKCNKKTLIGTFVSCFAEAVGQMIAAKTRANPTNNNNTQRLDSGYICGSGLRVATTDCSADTVMVMGCLGHERLKNVP